MFMLDTNVIIYCLRHPEDPINRIVEKHLGDDICISVITLAELEYGVHKSTRPDQNRTALQAMLAGISVIEMSADAAMHAGEILATLESKGERIGDRDTLIAAHARSMGYTLVTHNTKEFSRVNGLRLEDWQTF